MNTPKSSLNTPSFNEDASPKTRLNPSTQNGGPDDKVTLYAFYFFMSMVGLGLLMLTGLAFVA